MRLSASQIAMYRRCSMQWWFRYRAGIKLRPNLKLAKGYAVHRGVEIGYAYTLSTGSASPEDLVTDATAQAFDEEQRIGVLVEPDDPKPEVAKDRAVVLAKLHHQKIAPKVEPALVESTLRWQVPHGPEMIGKLDVLEVSGRIRDLKTSGRRMPEAQIRLDPQLALYVAGSEQQGLPATAIQLDRLVDTRMPKVQSLALPRTQVDTARTEAVARAVAAGIEREQFVPVDDTKICSWCGMRSICQGAKWWEYLNGEEGVEKARKAAQAVLEGNLLPEGARSIPIVSDLEDVPE